MKRIRALPRFAFWSCAVCAAGWLLRHRIEHNLCKEDPCYEVPTQPCDIEKFLGYKAQSLNICPFFSCTNPGSCIFCASKLSKHIACFWRISPAILVTGFSGCCCFSGPNNAHSICDCASDLQREDACPYCFSSTCLPWIKGAAQVYVDLLQVWSARRKTVWSYCADSLLSFFCHACIMRAHHWFVCRDGWVQGSLKLVKKA